MNGFQKDAIKSRLSEYVAEHAPRLPNGSYACPVCGSGTGAHGTSAFSIDGAIWHCFKCEAEGRIGGGDIFTLCGQVDHISGFNRQLEFLADKYGIALEGGGRGASNAAAAEPKKEEEDYTAYMAEAHKRICDTDYWRERGLSRETAERFRLGFDPDWENPKTGRREGAHLIIPTSPTSYSARGVLAGSQSKKKAGRTRIFNQAALEGEGDAVFVTEGAIDAMSIVEAGGEAVSLEGAGNWRGLTSYIKEHGLRRPLVLFLDNDSAGKNAQASLEEELKAMGVVCLEFDAGEYKDANDFLRGNKAALEKAVAASKEAAQSMAEAEAEEADRKKRAEEAAYIQQSTAAYIVKFESLFEQTRKTRRLSTGFKRLDGLLNGGLYAGLYVLGGGTSVGKTAFMLQMADAISKNEFDAERGTPTDARRGVLFFSLETSRYELMARSVSRIAYQEEGGGSRFRYSDILDAFRGDKFFLEGEGADMLARYLSEHGRYTAAQVISESVAGVTIEAITAEIDRYRRILRREPVVFVDYLQIIPHDPYTTDKQSMDRAVVALKRMSRDMNIPIIAASSINRAGYGEDVGLASYKESGGIEYTADVLFGLQFKKRSKDDDCKTDKNDYESRSRENRQMILRVIKNRRGGTGDIPLELHAPYSCFEETGSARSVCNQAQEPSWRD